MIPSHYQNAPDHIKQLFEWGDVSNREGNYRYNEWEDYLPRGFTDDDVPQLIEILRDKVLDELPDDDVAIWAQVYAWRILGQLQNEAAIEPLMTELDLNIDNDFVLQEFPIALGMLGKPMIPILAESLIDEAELETEDKRIASSTALAELVKHHPECREEVIAVFRDYLMEPDIYEFGFNGLTVSNLMDIKAVELIDEIRALYEIGSLDISIPGDIEDVEVALGLRQERSTPRPNYRDAKTALHRQYLAELDSAAIDLEAVRRAHLSPETYVRETPKVGRNDPCPCGSGKKYKKCCLNK